MSASEKSTLVRVLVRRFIPASELTNVGGMDYETSFIPKEPEAVYQDLGGISPTSLTFTYNASTGITELTTVGSGTVFADYPLYFTNGVTKYLHDDPFLQTGTIKTWEPRLTGNITATQSVKDQNEGFFSISSNTITLINEDFALHEFITPYDNYKNRPIVIYALIGGVVRRLSNGNTSQITDGKTVSLSIRNPPKLLQKSATFSNSKKYYEYNTTDWPSIDSERIGEPIPYCFGPLSNSPNTFYDSNPAVDAYFIDQQGSNLIKAAYRGNGEYILGVVKNAWALDEFIDVTEASRPTGRTVINIPSPYIRNFFRGRQLEWKDNLNVDGFSARGVVDVNYSLSQITVNLQLGAQTFAKIHMPSASVIYADSDGAQCTTIRNATGQRELLQETTDNGSTLVVLNLIGVTTPLIDQEVYTILINKEAVTHSNFCQNAIESSGLSVDSAQFVAAQAALDENVHLVVGAGSQLESHLDVIQKVINTTNGIIFFNDQTNVIGYRIVNSLLSGIDWTVDETDILEPELTPIIEYQDTASSISMKNELVNSETYLVGSSATVRSSISEVFNTEVKVKNLKSYLELCDTAIDFKAETNNYPKIYYRFSLKPDLFFGIQVGEIIRIQNVGARLIQTTGTVDLLIVEVSKSSEIIEVLGYEYIKIS